MRYCCCCSLTKSCLTLQPRGLQHARLPYPPLSPGVCSNFCPIELVMLSNHLILYHPSPFAFSLSQHQDLFQGVFLFTSGGQSIGTSALTSVLPVNEYSGLISFRTDWFDLLAFHGTVKSLLQHHIQKYQFFNTQKTIGLTIQPLLAK